MNYAKIIVDILYIFFLYGAIWSGALIAARVYSGQTVSAFKFRLFAVCMTVCISPFLRALRAGIAAVKPLTD